MYWILVSWILCQGLLKFTCAPLYLPWPTTLPTTRTTDNRSSSSSAPLVRPSLVCMSSLSCCVPCTCLPIYSTCLRLPVAFAQQSSLLLYSPTLVLFSTPPLQVLKFWMAGLADWCQVPLFVHVILREQPNTKEDYSTLAALLFSEDFCGKWDYYHLQSACYSCPCLTSYERKVTSSASSAAAASSSSCNNSTANINTRPLHPPPAMQWCVSA